MLGAATFVPIIGSAAAAADTGLYLYEGNYTDAALSSLAVIPGGKLASGFKALHAGDDAAKAAGAGTKLHILDDIVGAFCSFSADTPVATATGRTAIASIRVGDTVEAYDPKTGETGPHEVTAVSAKTDPVVEHLATDTGPIETTPNHPFFTADRGWVEAGQLLVGEQIRTESDHTTAVTGFTLDATPTTMWDLTVDGAHSFFVGSGGVLVHNACPGADLGDKLEYFFGHATGDEHNIQRSQTMASQLSQIGIGDTTAGRQLLMEHLAGILGDGSNIAGTVGNRTIRESLLAGPGGFLKVQSIWEDAKLITGMLFGG